MVEGWPPKIDKGLLVSRPSKWSFVLDLEVGDSFFLPGLSTKEIPGRFLRITDKHPEFKFECHNRTENNVEGVRVWRKS